VLKHVAFIFQETLIMRLTRLAAYLFLVSTVFAAGCASRQQRLFNALKGKTHEAVTPANRDGERHRSFNERVARGNVDLIFIGDSITQGWEGAGSDVWQRYYGGRNAVNLGISGDRTEHVLWRLENGNVDGISPKAAVVMIGTNNISRDRYSVQDVADGVTAVCRSLREKLPETKILLLAVFPRSQNPDKKRQRVIELNRIISGLHDGKHIFYLDIGGCFVGPDGTISKEVMPDFLHLSPAGYEVWAAAIEGELCRLLR
jgi:beta-glucosidase